MSYLVERKEIKVSQQRYRNERRKIKGKEEESRKLFPRINAWLMARAECVTRFVYGWAGSSPSQPCQQSMVPSFRVATLPQGPASVLYVICQCLRFAVSHQIRMVGFKAHSPSGEGSLQWNGW